MNAHDRFERLARASLVEVDCPPSSQLAQYILGMLRGMEQLQVAAHVRSCPFCQHDIAICRPSEARPPTRVARLLPLPLNEGLRTSSDTSQVRQYVAADIVVMLTIAPPVGECWRITGQLLRANAHLAGCTVLLRAGKRRYEQISDAQGFFTFPAVLPGRYTLSVRDAHVQVQIRDILLRLDAL